MSSDDVFARAAEAIGRRLVNDAIWHDGRCNWVGAVDNPAEPWRTKYRALDSNIYDGTAGVGLFLAQLAALTGDGALRRTAVGGLRHAVALRQSARDGFHAGRLGIAWAAARAAALIGDDELVASAHSLVTGEHPVASPDGCPDVITGSAGAILALLAFDDPTLVDEAAGIGDELLGKAIVTTHGWAWALPDRRHRRPLCGLSHGAAGVGWAMLELFAACGEDRFRVGAEGAFAYERSWLDADSGSWPDLRIGGQRRGTRPRIASPAVATWCHGEGGIALTRLRAIDVLGPEPYLSEAELALETTRRELAAVLQYEIDDLTLCHGAAGAADVMLCAAAALGGRWKKTSGLAAEVGHTALERYDATAQDWVCDATAGNDPGLFRGLSGIGWWFLRLHDCAVPSPLAIPMTVQTSPSTAVDLGG